MKATLYLVIPCYNEEEVLPETAKRSAIKMRELISAEKISEKSRILFVDDGSKDKTWEIIEQLHINDELFSGVKLSRNRGHQNALLAGLLTARERADMTISMDADLQDDINAIEQMIDKFYAGCDIVYGVRSTRDRDTAFKRLTAEGYYKVLKSMGAQVVFNHADYRLMSRRALEGLEDFDEKNLFLRGIVPMIGYPSDIVYYERGERFAGESKYPLKKMLSFAAEGITSLSTKPLRMITGMGFFLLFVSVVLFIIMLIGSFYGYALLGWRILLIVMILMSSLILISLGIIGEYLGKTYLETKRRPRFIIENILDK